MRSRGCSCWNSAPVGAVIAVRRSLLQQVLGGYPALDYYKIEDGKGRPLGRSFKVTLWPTVILLRDGQELARAVRPQAREDLHAMLAVLDATIDAR